MLRQLALERLLDEAREQGEVTMLFSEWSIDPKDIRVIYPSNRHLSPRVLLFVDELAKAVSKPAPQVDKKRKAPRKRV